MINLEFNQKYTNGKRFPFSEGYDLGLEHNWKVNKMLVNEQQRANAYVSHSGARWFIPRQARRRHYTI